MFFVSCIGSYNDLHLNISLPLFCNCFSFVLSLLYFWQQLYSYFWQRQLCSLIVLSLLYFDNSCIQIFDNNSSVWWLCTGRQNWQVGKLLKAPMECIRMDFQSIQAPSWTELIWMNLKWRCGTSFICAINILKDMFCWVAIYYIWHHEVK